MFSVKTWLNSVLSLFYTVKQQNLHWQQQNQQQQLELKQAEVLAGQVLAAELKKRSVQLAHDIALLKTENAAQLAMLKTQCRQDVKDYQQYLAALDQLKRCIKKSYSHLPEAVAFTIHHHAKQLLHQMWAAENFADKMHHELRLINFMTTVHEEARLQLLDGKQAVPEKTLSLIQQQ